MRSMKWMFLFLAVTLLALPTAAFAEENVAVAAEHTIVATGENMVVAGGKEGLWLLSGEDVLYLPDGSSETVRIGSAKGVTHFCVETGRRGTWVLADGTTLPEGSETLWLITEGAGQQALIGLTQEGRLVYRNWLPEGFFVHEFGVFAGNVFLLGTPEPNTGKGLPRNMAIYVSPLKEEMTFQPLEVSGWKNTRISSIDLRDQYLYVERLVHYYVIDLENRTCVAENKPRYARIDFQGMQDGPNFNLYTPGYMSIERINLVTGRVYIVAQNPPRDTVRLALTDHALYGLHGSHTKVYRLMYLP